MRLIVISQCHLLVMTLSYNKNMSHHALVTLLVFAEKRGLHELNVVYCDLSSRHILS